MFHIRNRWVDKADVIIECGCAPTFKQFTAFVYIMVLICTTLYHNPSTLAGYSKSRCKQTNTIMMTQGETFQMRQHTLGRAVTVVSQTMCKLCGPLPPPEMGARFTRDQATTHSHPTPQLKHRHIPMFLQDW